MRSILGVASILHVDLDAFYASVEQRDDPALRGRPVLVGGGVVLACSYEAKAVGVRTAMNGRQARALCPDAVVVEPRMHAYTEASRAVFAIFEDTTPLVEGISIDEAFLDVGGLARLRGPAAHIAAELRQRVHDEVGLAITVGVARTKFLAKVASGVGKPDGLLVVEPDAELEFLHPLPVQRLWGVGPVTAQKLAAKSIHTVGDVARLQVGALVAILGPGPGRHLHALAHNRDPRPVEARKRRGSIGSQHALGRRARTRREIDDVLLGLVDRVTRRLRAGDRVARTVTLRFRHLDMSRATRSHTLEQATHDTDLVLEVARALLDARWPDIEQVGLTLLGLAVSNLDDAGAVQLGLPFTNRSRPDRDAVVDRVRERFGTGAIGRAGIVRQRHVEMPQLADPGPGAEARR